MEINENVFRQKGKFRKLCVQCDVTTPMQIVSIHVPLWMLVKCVHLAHHIELSEAGDVGVLARDT